MLPLMLQTFLSLDTHTHTYIHVLLIKTKRILPLINKKRIQFVKRRLVPSSRTFTRKRSAAGNNGNLWPPASFNPRRFSNYPENYPVSPINPFRFDIALFRPVRHLAASWPNYFPSVENFLPIPSVQQYWISWNLFNPFVPPRFPLLPGYTGATIGSKDFLRSGGRR